MTYKEKEILRKDLNILREISQCLIVYILMLLFIGIICGIGIVMFKLLGL